MVHGHARRIGSDENRIVALAVHPMARDVEIESTLLPGCLPGCLVRQSVFAALHEFSRTVENGRIDFVEDRNGRLSSWGNSASEHLHPACIQIPTLWGSKPLLHSPRIFQWTAQIVVPVVDLWILVDPHDDCIVPCSVGHGRKVISGSGGKRPQSRECCRNRRASSNHSSVRAPFYLRTILNGRVCFGGTAILSLLPAPQRDGWCGHSAACQSPACHRCFHHPRSRATRK